MVLHYFLMTCLLVQAGVAWEINSCHTTAAVGGSATL